MPSTLTDRIRGVNEAPVRSEGRFVLYWMISARRLGWNHGLERAVGWARALDLPLLILEPLRAGYRWAAERHHRFCIQGMAEHAARLEGSGVGYRAYVEPHPGDGKGLLAALGREAALVVTDDFPGFFLPRMVSAAGPQLDVRLEAVDSNGVLPLAWAPKDFKTAQSFRRFQQSVLPELLRRPPAPDPLADSGLPSFPGLPAEITERWPATPRAALGDPDRLVKEIPLDREVGPVAAHGGSKAGRTVLRTFVRHGLPDYARWQNHPDRERNSGLSPWIHWGHVSAWEVMMAVLDREEWSEADLRHRPTGKRSGWWGLSADAEAFLEQLLVWREMGYVTAWRDPRCETWDSLPEWSRHTLEAHAADPRPHAYGREALEEARTHDALWNAAQRELRERGVIHNYLRMLWGKKILEWTGSPQEALSLMLELNNRWGLDGRDPNSTSGIFWTLGRYDRGWPERPIYGKVRSMSSERTRKKVEVTRYLERFRESV